MDKMMDLKLLLTFLTLPAILSSCVSSSTSRDVQSQTPSHSTPTAASTLTVQEAEFATLHSLEQEDEYPLYSMHYIGTYPGWTQSYEPPAFTEPLTSFNQTSCSASWGCSLFTAMGDDNDRILGRNFDWQFSPALLLFTAPEDGYASVSMVDIAYLGFEGERARNLTDLPLKDLRPLLDAPALPFDGMNAKGLAVGMAAVPAQAMPFDPAKKTIDQLEVIREILDHAGTVEEAIEIFDQFNIDMGSVPIHYLITSANGESAVVEFYQGRMVVFRSGTTWQVATNFLLASMNRKEQGYCWRYDLLDQRLAANDGHLSSEAAMHLLAEVSQDNTQWSVVYHMVSGNLDVIMGRRYQGEVHTFQLERTTR